MNRLIDSRNCYELIQRGFVISENNKTSNHENIRTVEERVSSDKGGMIISPQTGLHENVVVLDYDSGYPNLIVNHNLSYETVLSKGEQVKKSQNKKGLLDLNYRFEGLDGRSVLVVSMGDFGDTPEHEICYVESWDTENQRARRNKIMQKIEMDKST